MKLYVFLKQPPFRTNKVGFCVPEGIRINGVFNAFSVCFKPHGVGYDVGLEKVPSENTQYAKFCQV